MFLYALAREYANTHDQSYQTPPSPELPDLVRHWLAGVGQAELEPTEGDSLISAGDLLSKELDRIRQANLDVLDPDFAVAMDDAARSIRAKVGFYHHTLGVPDDPYRGSAVGVVEAVVEIANLLERRSGLRPAIAPEMLRGLEVTHEDEMRRRGRR